MAGRPGESTAAAISALRRVHQISWAVPVKILSWAGLRLPTMAANSQPFGSAKCRCCTCAEIGVSVAPSSRDDVTASTPPSPGFLLQLVLAGVKPYRFIRPIVARVRLWLHAVGVQSLRGGGRLLAGNCTIRCRPSSLAVPPLSTNKLIISLACFPMRWTFHELDHLYLYLVLHGSHEHVPVR